MRFMQILKAILFTGLITIIVQCQNASKAADSEFEKSSFLTKPKAEIKIGKTIASRFPTPSGFERTTEDKNSFGAYLRNLELYDTERQVYLFNGRLKHNQSAHVAVVKMDVGNSDLQQCADATMRLRAEYLYKEKRYDDIHFNFTSGFNAEYKKWRKGNRIEVKGNKCSWKSTNEESESYASFRKYLKEVFMYAGTASLSKELKSKRLGEMEIGDLFIKGGFPGHAVIVVDLAVNPDTHEKLFILAQSYMPAQDIHVLKNENNTKLSPWYALDESAQNLATPEWAFTSDQLKGFGFK